MPDVRIEPYPLLYDVTGDGAPVVLVPGGLSGWVSWEPFVEPLAKDRQVVRVQLRSVELAEAGGRVPSNYGSLTERDALLATVDRLGLQSFDLVGWSYGGHVSLAFAMEHPQRVRTLTVIEPPAFWILRETGNATDTLDRFEAADRSIADRDISIDDLKDFAVRAGLGKPGDPFESLPGWPVWVRNRHALSANGTIWDYTDSLGRLRSLDLPVLAVRGTGTSDVFTAMVDDLLSTVPDGQLLELPGGHACHLQHMDGFLAALTSHMSGVRV